MNKVILSLLLAVCVLGMALIMLNEKMRKPEQAPVAQASVNQQAADPGVDSQTGPEAALPSLGDAVQAPKSSGGAQPYLPPLPVESGHTPAPADTAPHLGDKAPYTAEAVPVHPPLPEPAKHKPDFSGTPEKSSDAAKPETASTAAPAASGASAAPEKARTPEKAAPAEKPASGNTEKAAKAAPQKLEITRFVVFARDKGATVRLVGTAPLNYKNMTLNSPERLVVDLDGKWQVKAPGVPKNPVVTNVRLGKMDGKTRVVIDLSGKPASVRYVLSKDKLSLDIRVDQ
ncbi:MAG: hypothetical protein BCS36_02740 [Desulfovibrio sp. MES5]|uniref:AMIN domain-containing protein n=1 Tax=Desulfovibrio sp. MES5 TaxID=1899016 RepID=UPI000B9C8713|nr:AMIN domain-containing protein [Desulfovibrio sp. MES5]OXS27985.1 MAG: hypothetical protein BCS36_02740 [Desulfovibrio sp. MES5]